MRIWIVIAIITSILIFAGILSVMAITQTETVKNPANCGNCKGLCNSEKNCGLSGCGALEGKTCNCNNLP